MFRNVLALIVVATLIAIGPATTSADDKDTAGCDGLSAYSDKMLDAGKDYLDDLEEDGVSLDADPLSYSSEDWTMLAENAGSFRDALDEIDPPAFAAEWHEAQREGL